MPLRARVQAPAPGMERGFALEIQRVLSAQALLREAGRVQHAGGGSAVALKGAVPLLAGRERLDLADVDLLVAQEWVAPLADGLERAGYRVGKDAAVPPDAPGGWERAVRAAEGSIQAELHVAAPFVGPGADPAAGARPTPIPGIRVPAPAEHLWHVLVHGTLHHPDRRGVLRELLLLSDAMGASTPGELDEVRRRAAAHPAGGVMARALDAAGSLPSGAPDRFAAEAALRYLMAGRHARLPRRLRPRLWHAAFALLEGGGEYRRLWFGSAASAGGQGLLRLAWRGAPLAALTPLAASAVRAARRLARPG